MGAAKAATYFDEDPAQEVAQRAAQRGEAPEQLVADVLRRHFLVEALERIWARNRDDLTEDQALKLATARLRLCAPSAALPSPPVVTGGH